METRFGFLLGVVAAALVTFGSACGVDDDFGDTSIDPVDEVCREFVMPPATDCTAGGDTCDFDQDCGWGEACNQSTRRCFVTTSRCAGTPCVWNSDCGGGEACNNETGRCYAINESQTCMPCFRHEDCGRTACNLDTRRCR